LDDRQGRERQAAEDGTGGDAKAYIVAGQQFANPKTAYAAADKEQGYRQRSGFNGKHPDLRQGIQQDRMVVKAEAGGEGQYHQNGSNNFPAVEEAWLGHTA